MRKNLLGTFGEISPTQLYTASDMEAEDDDFAAETTEEGAESLLLGEAEGVAAVAMARGGEATGEEGCVASEEELLDFMAERGAVAKKSGKANEAKDRLLAGMKGNRGASKGWLDAGGGMFGSDRPRLSKEEEKFFGPEGVQTWPSPFARQDEKPTQERVDEAFAQELEETPVRAMTEEEKEELKSLKGMLEEQFEGLGVMSKEHEDRYFELKKVGRKEERMSGGEATVTEAEVKFVVESAMERAATTARSVGVPMIPTSEAEHMGVGMKKPSFSLLDGYGEEEEVEEVKETEEGEEQPKKVRTPERGRKVKQGGAGGLLGRKFGFLGPWGRERRVGVGGR